MFGGFVAHEMAVLFLRAVCLIRAMAWVSEHDVLTVDESSYTFALLEQGETLNLRIGALFGVEDFVALSAWVGGWSSLEIAENLVQIRDVDSFRSKTGLKLFSALAGADVKSRLSSYGCPPRTGEGACVVIHFRHVRPASSEK